MSPLFVWPGNALSGIERWQHGGNEDEESSKEITQLCHTLRVLPHLLFSELCDVGSAMRLPGWEDAEPIDDERYETARAAPGQKTPIAFWRVAATAHADVVDGDGRGAVCRPDIRADDETVAKRTCP